MNKKLLENRIISAFFLNIGVMLKAGISTQEAVHLLAEDSSDDVSDMKECLAMISEEMSDGNSFSRALKKTGLFPEYAVNMLEAAEYTGNLEAVLYRLGDYYENEEKNMKTLLSAVRYPISLLSMIVILLAVMLILVFPTFRSVYNNLAGSMTASSYKYIDTTVVVCIVLLAILAAFIILLLAGVHMWRNGKKDRVRKFLCRFPSLARVIEGFDLYRFTACFRMFLAGGHTQDEALQAGLAAVETDILREKISVMAEQMKGGKSFSQAAFSESLYDPVDNRLLVPAERSGHLDVVMERIDNVLEVHNTERIEKLAGTVEPVLTGVLLISVGLMLISLMIPLIGIMNSIG